MSINSRNAQETDVSIRFGVSPIAWINDDMPELGGDTPLERVFAEARDIGFTGIELGGKFPRDPETLSALLARFQLALVGGWYSASLLTRSAREEIAACRRTLSFCGRWIAVCSSTPKPAMRFTVIGAGRCQQPLA